MNPRKIAQLIEETRDLRLNQLADRLLADRDREDDALQWIRWSIEEEFNESIWVSLDMLGWNRSLLEDDLQQLHSDMAALLRVFEEREEYECCAVVQEAGVWLQGRVDYLLAEIARGERAEDLIGL